MRYVTILAVTVSVVGATMVGQASEKKAPAPATVSATTQKAASSKPPPAPAPAPPPPAAPTSAGTTTGETLEEIVARVRRRLASDVPRSPVRRAPVAPAQSARVTLVWRATVVWPVELVPPTPDVSANDASRVTLDWPPPSR